MRRAGQAAALAVSLALAGCVSVPRQTVTLNEELGGMIAASKSSHLALLDQYTAERQQRIDDFMRHVWAPRFIKRFLAKIDFNEAVCEVKGKMDRALVVQDLAEAVSRKIFERRKALEDALRRTERLLRRKLRSHYAGLERANDAISTNLRSVLRVQQLRDEVVKALRIPGEDVLPMDEASEALNALFEIREEAGK